MPTGTLVPLNRIKDAFLPPLPFWPLTSAPALIDQLLVDTQLRRLDYRTLAFRRAASKSHGLRVEEHQHPNRCLNRTPPLGRSLIDADSIAPGHLFKAITNRNAIQLFNCGAEVIVGFPQHLGTHCRNKSQAGAHHRLSNSYVALSILDMRKTLRACWPTWHTISAQLDAFKPAWINDFTPVWPPVEGLTKPRYSQHVRCTRGQSVCSSRRLDRIKSVPSRAGLRKV
jgi:hypothetical protein